MQLGSLNVTGRREFRWLAAQPREQNLALPRLTSRGSARKVSSHHSHVRLMVFLHVMSLLYYKHLFGRYYFSTRSARSKSNVGRIGSSLLNRKAARMGGHNYFCPPSLRVASLTLRPACYGRTPFKKPLIKSGFLNGGGGGTCGAPAFAPGRDYVFILLFRGARRIIAVSDLP